MTMLKEGMTVYYVEGSDVFSGQVTDVEELPGGGYEFSINSYGACEGQYRISSGQVGKTVFMTEEQAKGDIWL